MESAGSVADGDGAGAHDFRQLAILREFSNIANCVSEDEFLRVMPTEKLKKVKWLQMLKILRERVQLGVSADWAAMWEEEGLAEKLETIERQREKYSDASRVQPAWRPELANVKAQLRPNDASILLKMKEMLEREAKEYDNRVAKLQKTVQAKRSYLRAVQVEIQKCQKKNNEWCQNIYEHLRQHSETVKEISPLSGVEDFDVSMEI